VNREQPEHKLTMTGRSNLTVTGVSQVVSFEEDAVLLRTGLGDLRIHGSGLQLKDLTLDGGQAAISGQIAALVYEEPREGGWLSRLLGR